MRSNGLTFIFLSLFTTVLLVACHKNKPLTATVGGASLSPPSGKVEPPPFSEHPPDPDSGNPPIIPPFLPPPPQSFCGALIANAGNRYSITLGGSYAGHIPCGAHPVLASCPAGYKHVTTAFTAWNDDDSLDTTRSCVLDDTFPPLVPVGGFCGLSIQNAGTRPSLWVNGSEAPVSSTCGGSTAANCPAGFVPFSFSTAAWNDDSMADTASGCIRYSQVGAITRAEDLRTGQWCGLTALNQGTHNSLCLAGACATQNSIPCLGMDPVIACPVGFSKLSNYMTAWHADSMADGFITCVKR